jgi:hypothetical protein
MLLLLGACMVQPAAQAEKKAATASAVQYKINFNSQQSLGKLSYYDCVQNLRWQADCIKDGTDLGPARGTVTLTVPSGKRLGLYLNTWAFSNPELLDKITPNVIEGLVLQARAGDDDDSEDQRITKVILHLGNFTHLKELCVDKSGANDAQLAGLPTLMALERFSAGSALSVVGTSLKRLSQLPNLHSVCLKFTSFDGKNLALLKDFKKLEHLNLAQTNLQGRLKYLPVCLPLKELDISSSRITDNDLKYLLQLKNLEILGVNNCKISDKGLPAIAGLKKLKVLNLQNTSVTIDGVTSLAKNMHLAQLLLTDRHFTPTEHQLLKSYCPSVFFGTAPHPQVPTKEMQRLFAPITRDGKFEH